MNGILNLIQTDTTKFFYKIILIGLFLLKGKMKSKII